LNIGGTSTITNLTATAAGNTVNYTGVSQTVKTTTYYNLILSGSGVKTIANGTVINGNLSIDPNIVDTATASLAAGANISVNYLTLGGTLQNLGASTWGGTGSGANNINTTYFAASTGYLTVAH
jgi:hypothetical protein